MLISLCLATYNEASNIHYPLDSCIDWVDEVVIVDGRSSDSTVEIAKSYGKKVRVIETDNPRMFHINKQKAIEAAKGDWILQLDADEEVTDGLRQEIQKISNFKLKIENSPQAYYIPRKNWFLNRFLMKGGVYPDYTIRLYKNGVARFPCIDVHENVAVNGKIGYLENPLLHYSDPTFDRYFNRWQRYNTLEAQKLINDKKSCSFLDYVFVKPLVTFFMMYFRHLGFMDGFPGLVFSFFSSIKFSAIYFKFKHLL